MAGLEHAPIDVPADLDEHVRAYLDDPEASWDEAVAAIVEEGDADAD